MKKLWGRVCWEVRQAFPPFEWECGIGLVLVQIACLVVTWLGIVSFFVLATMPIWLRFEAARAIWVAVGDFLRKIQG